VDPLLGIKAANGSNPALPVGAGRGCAGAGAAVGAEGAKAPDPGDGVKGSAVDVLVN
jgi:hypothetical protein